MAGSVDGVLAGYLTRPELAEQLGRSEVTIARWERDMALPVRRIGRKRIYDIDEIRRWIDGEAKLRRRGSAAEPQRGVLRRMPAQPQRAQRAVVKRTRPSSQSRFGKEG